MITKLTSAILEKVKYLVLDYLKDENVTIILFGSRARGDFNKFSDIDIGIIPYSKIDNRKIILLRDSLENMNIPYTVDIVDLSKVSNTFKQNALKEKVIWKN
ncbi:MAG: nucleotidyltransferase domain-containing protein [Spirochaetales bacterium]|nr:nucleotidyltransferase domain-containing protein [Spirochaetales bacterium]